MNVEEFYAVYSYVDPDHPKLRSAHRSEADAVAARPEWSPASYRVESVYGVLMADRKILVLGRVEDAIGLEP